MKEYKEQNNRPHTLDSNPKSSKQKTIGEILQCYRNGIQMYAETQTDDVMLISEMQATRSVSGFGYTKDACQKNFAFNNDDRNIWAYSQNNRHSEPGVVMRSNPNASNDINIVTERAPCDKCAQDMKNAETNRDLNGINVLYFVTYDSKAQNNLYNLYNSE